jgi:hypothetical protein
MSEEIQTANPELTPTELVQEQRRLGAEWADAYAAAEYPLSGAEIVLRNPSVYLHDVDIKQLPDDLQRRWTGVNHLADGVVSLTTAADQSRWSPGTSGVAKLQHLMVAGELGTDSKGATADVLKAASEVFADSARILPGNTKYYAGNVKAMGSWLKVDR